MRRSEWLRDQSVRGGRHSTRFHESSFFLWFYSFERYPSASGIREESFWRDVLQWICSLNVRVFVSQSECQREADIWLFHDWCTCLERALEAFSGFVILCFRNWRLKFLTFFPTYSLFLCYATLTLVNRLDVSERILLFDHNVDCFFLFPVMEDMLTVGPHYLRLHNLKSTSGLIKNSCSVGITSEKFRAHKNNLWSIIPSPPAPRLMCIFILGYGVLMLFLLFCQKADRYIFIFIFFILGWQVLKMHLNI